MPLARGLGGETVCWEIPGVSAKQLSKEADAKYPLSAASLIHPAHYVTV